MIPITKPATTALQSLKISTSRTRSREKQNKFRSAARDIYHTSNAFESLLPEARLHQLRPQDSAGLMTKNDLNNLYSNNFLDARSTGRVIYDSIFQSAPYQICPRCGLGEVKTLDHHLPQSRFPILSIAPINLIPTCYDCNFEKGFEIPRSSKDEILHPYFDNVCQEIWLRAIIDRNPVIRARYYLQPPVGWGTEITDRLHGHMDSFNLYSRFSSHADKELNYLKGLLKNLESKGAAPNDIKELLNELAEGEKDNFNGFKVVLHRALASTPWYYSGGYND